MPSEKLKYLNRGPSPVLKMNQLKQHLSSFTQEQLIEIVWLSAERNTILWKALNAHIGIKCAENDWEQAKAAIDYAFYFPNIVSYTERGHEIIVYEMLSALEILYENGNKEFAIRAAECILEEGQNLRECFDDDWSWSCALGYIDEWICNKK